MIAEDDPEPVRADAHARVSIPPPALHSDDLFRGTHEIVIVHGTEQYRLRITRAGKLILTK